MEAIRRNELRRQTTLHIGQGRQRCSADFPAIRRIGQAVQDRRHIAFAGQGQTQCGRTQCMRLRHVHRRSQVTRRALQVISHRQMLLVTQVHFHHVGNVAPDRAGAAAGNTKIAAAGIA